MRAKACYVHSESRLAVRWSQTSGCRQPSRATTRCSRCAGLTVSTTARNEPGSAQQGQREHRLDATERNVLHFPASAVLTIGLASGTTKSDTWGTRDAETNKQTNKQTHKQASKQTNNQSKQRCRDGRLTAPRGIYQRDHQERRDTRNRRQGGADYNIAPRTLTPTPSLLLPPPCCVVGGAASAVRYEGRPWPRSAAHTTVRMFSAGLMSRWNSRALRSQRTRPHTLRHSPNRGFHATQNDKAHKQATDLVACSAQVTTAGAGTGPCAPVTRHQHGLLGVAVLGLELGGHS